MGQQAEIKSTSNHLSEASSQSETQNRHQNGAAVDTIKDDTAGHSELSGVRCETRSASPQIYRLGMWIRAWRDGLFGLALIVKTVNSF